VAEFSLSDSKLYFADQAIFPLFLLLTKQFLS